MTHPGRAGDAPPPGGVTPAALLSQEESPARDSVTLVTPVFTSYPTRSSASNQRPRLPTAAWCHAYKGARGAMPGGDSVAASARESRPAPVSPRGHSGPRLAGWQREQGGRLDGCSGPRSILRRRQTPGQLSGDGECQNRQCQKPSAWVACRKRERALLRGATRESKKSPTVGGGVNSDTNTFFP